MSRTRRINYTGPDGTRIGITIPVGVDPEALVAEFQNIERQILFGHARAIVSLDGPPCGLRRRLRWFGRCCIAAARQRGKQAWAYTLGRRTAERRIQAGTDAFRTALANTTPPIETQEKAT